MRSAGRLLLLAGLGAVFALVTLFLVGPRRAPPVGAEYAPRSFPTATPRLAPTPSRPIPAASTGASNRDVAEPEPAASARETTAERAAVSPFVAAAGAPNLRLGDIPASVREWFVERNDISAYPPRWCFRLGGAATEEGAAARLHVALDSRVVSQGSHSARVDTKSSLPPGVTAVLWQAVSAQAYRGSRVELVAQVRSEAPVAHVFLRSQAFNGPTLNLLRSDLAGVQGVNQSIATGADWTRVAAVHDVPFDAGVVYYGVALYGNGSLWLDDVHVNVITATAPLAHDDSVDDDPSIPIVPVWFLRYPGNLDFELNHSEPVNNCHLPDPE